MKFFRNIISLLWVFLLLDGCQQPAPISVIDNSDDSRLIEMKPIDTSVSRLFSVPAVDSSDVLGEHYFGRLVLSSVRYDFPQGSDSLLEAEAIFLDHSRPIEGANQLVAYHSFDAGEVVLNSDTLAKVIRRVNLPSSAVDSTIGVRYQTRGEFDDLSGSPFQWVATGGNSLSPFGAVVSFRVTAPKANPIRVISLHPRYISPTQPLTVGWQCSNPEVDITISRDGGTAQRSWIPVLQLRVSNVKGSISIPTKILEVLPTNRYRQFLVTFSSSRDSVVALQRFPDEVLVRSASIHNFLLDVHP